MCNEINFGFLWLLSLMPVAFAELQTDMTDLTADLQSLGTPTLDHKTYVMKVFFPGVNDHPILNDPKVKIANVTGFF